MRVTVEHDNGKTEVFQNVTDLYAAMRFEEFINTDRGLALFNWTHSYSWGGNLRELVKEVQQSLVELQDHLRSMRSGNPG